MSKTTGKRTSPSVERQLALALVAVIEEAGGPGTQLGDELDNVLTDARAILKTHGYENLESIPSRVRTIQAEIKDATDNGQWAKLAKLSADMIRAEKGLSPLATEKKARASRKPKTETPPVEKKTRKKKDDGTSDLILRDDANLESLTEGQSEAEHEAEWLTRHPEPKD